MDKKFWLIYGSIILGGTIIAGLAGIIQCLSVFVTPAIALIAVIFFNIIYKQTAHRIKLGITMGFLIGLLASMLSIGLTMILNVAGISDEISNQTLKEYNFTRDEASTIISYVFLSMGLICSLTNIISSSLCGLLAATIMGTYNAGE
jgi:hypothetical protein